MNSDCNVCSIAPRSFPHLAQTVRICPLWWDRERWAEVERTGRERKGKRHRVIPTWPCLVWVATGSYGKGKEEELDWGPPPPAPPAWSGGGGSSSNSSRRRRRRSSAARGSARAAANWRCPWTWRQRQRQRSTWRKALFLLLLLFSPQVGLSGRCRSSSASRCSPGLRRCRAALATRCWSRSSWAFMATSSTCTASSWCSSSPKSGVSTWTCPRATWWASGAKCAWCRCRHRWVRQLRDDGALPCLAPEQRKKKPAGLPFFLPSAGKEREANTPTSSQEDRIMDPSCLRVSRTRHHRRRKPLYLPKGCLPGQPNSHPRMTNCDILCPKYV